MGHLWARTFVAFLVMEGLTAIGAAVWHVYGPGRGVEVREFPSALTYALFASMLSVPFHLGALLGTILPVAALLQAFRRSLSLPTAILVGVSLSAPAFCVVVTGNWLIEGGPFGDFVMNVLRFPRSNALLLVTFAVGGAVVLSDRRRILSRPT